MYNYQPRGTADFSKIYPHTDITVIYTNLDNRKTNTQPVEIKEIIDTDGNKKIYILPKPLNV
jgi:hypothetical protein